MSLSNALAADRRLCELKAMFEDTSYTLNETTLVLVCKHVGHTTWRDQVRSDLQWLKDQGLIRLEIRPDGSGGEMWIAVLTPDGAEVAQGRTHPGVTRPGPR